MYGLLYECKFLTIEETNKKKKKKKKNVCDGSRRNEHLYRGPSIDASYQIYVYLVKRFQRKRFFLEIGQSETRIACGSHTYDGLGRNEQSL